jgi:hydrogenase maturation protease
MNDIVLIGLGSEYRSDDALGLLVARELSRRALEGIRVLEAQGEVASLLHVWEDARCALLVDALSAPDPPGAVMRFDLSEAGLPAFLKTASSHLIGLVEAVELARQLQRLPRTTILYGIVGKCFEMGTGLSDCVVKAIPELLRLIDADLRSLHTT